MQVQSLALLSGLQTWWYGSDAQLPRLWRRPATSAPTWPLAWELPYATGEAPKRKKKCFEQMSDLIRDGLYLFPRASIEKCYRLGRQLKQEKCIFSQFCRLKVQDQGSSRVGIFCSFSPGPVSSPRWTFSLTFLQVVFPVCTSSYLHLLLEGHQS